MASKMVQIYALFFRDDGIYVEACVKPQGFNYTQMRLTLKIGDEMPISLKTELERLLASLEKKIETNLAWQLSRYFPEEAE